MKKILVIAGPTGVGKTKLSVALAKLYNGEIISGDSMQVYRNMDIGTAKITESEMQGVPHYFIDSHDFDEEYNVKVFQEQARKYIDDMIERGKLPIICGGTGLYIKSLVYDYKFVDQDKDDTFMEFLKQRSDDELWSMLEIVDEETAKTLHRNNRQRIIRALSMAHDGQKKSEILEEQEHKPMATSLIGFLAYHGK